MAIGQTKISASQAKDFLKILSKFQQSNTKLDRVITILKDVQIQLEQGQESVKVAQIALNAKQVSMLLAIISKLQENGESLEGLISNLGELTQSIDEIQIALIQMQGTIIEELSDYFKAEHTALLSTLTKLQSKELQESVDRVLSKLKISRETLQEQIHSIKSGKDENVAILLAEYGEKCRDFYIAVRNSMLAMYKYLIIFSTGSLETPLGDAGDRLENIDHFIQLGLSLTTTLPIPFIDVIEVAGGEILYRSSLAAQGLLKRKMTEKFTNMLMRLQSVELQGEESVEHFCKDISYKIVKRYSDTISVLADDKIDTTAQLLVKYILEESVGGRMDIEEIIITTPKSSKRFKKLKTLFRKLRKRRGDSIDELERVTKDEDVLIPDLPLMFGESASTMLEALQFPKS